MNSISDGLVKIWLWFDQLEQEWMEFFVVLWTLLRVIYTTTFNDLLYSMTRSQPSWMMMMNEFLKFLYLYLFSRKKNSIIIKKCKKQFKNKSENQITWSCDVSYVATDDQTWRMLAHITGIETGDPRYVFDCGESIHRFGQISNHILSNGIHMVFLPYVSFDGPSNGSIWYKS